MWVTPRSGTNGADRYGSASAVSSSHAPGAFAGRDAEVVALYGHEKRLLLPLGNTKSGTLRVDDDGKGQSFELEPPDTAFACDLLLSIERGDVSDTSFGFALPENDREAILDKACKMRWTTFQLNGRQLTHVQQDDGTNQCVAASLAMVCKNAGYSGHIFGEGALFSQGRSAMRRANPDIPLGGMSDKVFVSTHGIRHNAVTLYLGLYGFKNVRAVSVSHDEVGAVAAAINNMANGDSAILACGVDAFHALAAFKIDNTIYVLNPMPGSPDGRGCAYTRGDDAVAVQGGGDHTRVSFNVPAEGEAYWRSVDACFLMPSQWYLGTIKRWLIG